MVQPRFYQAGKKCREKNRVRPNLGTTFTERPGEKCRFFFPLQISLFFFFFFFENQFLEKLGFKTSFFNHPNTLFLLAAGYFVLSSGWLASYSGSVGGACIILHIFFLFMGCCCFLYTSLMLSNFYLKVYAFVYSKLWGNHAWTLPLSFQTTAGVFSILTSVSYSTTLWLHRGLTPHPHPHPHLIARITTTPPEFSYPTLLSLSHNPPSSRHILFFFFFFLHNSSLNAPAKRILPLLSGGGGVGVDVPQGGVLFFFSLFFVFFFF